MADEHLTQSMSLTEDEHHTSTEQSLIKRALTEDGILERMTLTEDEYPIKQETA